MSTDTVTPVLDKATNGVGKYDASSIQHLQDADHIRKRTTHITVIVDDGEEI